MPALEDSRDQKQGICQCTMSSEGGSVIGTSLITASSYEVNDS